MKGTTSTAGRATRVALAAAVVVCAGRVSADQIKQIEGTSLTAVKFTTAALGQNIRMQYHQRGANPDGSLRARGGYAWALNADPFEPGAGGTRLGLLDLPTGAYSPTDVDWAGPAPGASGLIVGRTYNQRQEVSGSHHNSDGYQGKNFAQLAQPEIVQYDADADSQTRQSSDLVYVVYGADRYIEFKRTASNEDTFQARNGAAGVILYTSGSPDTFVWTDQHGNKTTFFGGNTSSGHGDWQFWKIEDPAGNVAYVGDKTTPGTAVTNGYSSKRILVAYDGAPSDGRRYTFTHSSVDGTQRLTEAKVETKSGGTWASPSGLTEIARVTYDYYTAAEVTENPTRDGPAGHLQSVEVRTSLSDSGSTLSSGVYATRSKKLYRYYTESWSDSDGRRGGPGMLELVLDSEGARQYDLDQDSTLDDDFLSASNSSLKEYSSAFFEYASGSEWRPSKAFFNGECGCGGGVNGAYEFAYATGSNYSTAIANTSYDYGANDWARTVIKQPDGIYESVYFDEAGQRLSSVKTDGDPGVSYTDMWATQVIRDALGCVTEVRSPAANDNSYTHSSGSFTAHSGTGLITLYERETASVDTKGFLVFVKHQQGTGGTVYYDAKTEYTDRDLNISGSVYVTRPMASARRAYHEVNVESAGKDTASNYRQTSQTYAWWSATNTNVLYIAPKQVTTTFPAVSTANNGSNSALTSDQYLRQDGTTAFTKSTGGRIDSTQYTGGRVTKRIEDADTDEAVSYPSGEHPYTNFDIPESLDGVHRTTSYAYDAQGRLDTTTLPDGRVTKNYYSRLKDQRTVAIAIPRVVAGSPTYYGPASYTVSNQAGKPTFQGLIAITSSGLTDALSTWITEDPETAPDPIADLEKGTLARMSTSVYSKPGTQLNESRSYFTIPGSGTGSEGSNYDSVRYGYNTMGKQIRVKDATGTITRQEVDDLQRVREIWVGTNDADEGGGDDMVKATTMQYDGNADGGNSLMTQQKRDQDGNWGTTGDQETTDYSYDLRGRQVVAVNSLAPHSVALFDNLGRQTAVGLYSSSSGLDASDDPTSLATNRVALSRTYFDEMGRVYLNERCNIDQSDGSNDDQLQTLTWYDAEGRVCKVDGESLTKTLYDRLGRATHECALAKHNDTVYADADDLSGDIVLEEVQKTYESTDSDNVVMRATIARHYDDLANETTGALDSNADSNAFKYTMANVSGRPMIEGIWYDDLDRVTDTVRYGTYGGSDFDRKPSGSWLTVPSRSDTALRTTTAYNDDGTLLEVEDPKSLKTRYAYDALGRKVMEIRNYVNGTPSGTPDYLTCPDDNITRFTFSKGLQATMWVDFDGDGDVDTSEPKDQVTRYIYGSTAGTPSQMKLTTGNLLRAVEYPDTTNAGTTKSAIDSDSSDVVSYAYNAQGRQVYMKDQAGNVIETDLDTAGRETYRRVTTLAGGFDGAVRRIGTSYDSRGNVEKVTQYDNAAVGSGSVVDEVKYTRDGWGAGNITLFEQDRNSTVAGGGDDREVAYTWAKNTTGRNTVRRTRVTMPNATYVDLIYDSTGNKLDNDASRVTQLYFNDGESIVVTYAAYEYNGVAQVVSTTHDEPDVFYRAYSSGTTYDRLDRFNRPISDIWTKDLATDRDFVDRDYTWDRNSNVTDMTDNVHATAGGNRNFDALYTIDSLNRLTQTEEGTLSGTISNRSRNEVWTLGQTGNWKNHKWDHNGDNDYSDSGEYQEDGTFNPVNEWTKRELDTNNTAGYETTYDPLAYDAAGNLTDDLQTYEYVYDAFHRLREVRNTSNQALVAEFKYNGLGYRSQWHYETRSPGGLDNGDPWFVFVYDPDWRLAAVYRADYNNPYTLDTYPKEEFIPHLAGLGGTGGSSYIDGVVLRNRDENGGWTSASDGVLEMRSYYCQGWQQGVLALVTDTGKLLEWPRYSSYGVPTCLPAGDSDADGDYDATDATEITDGDGYQVAQDADLDGDNDAADNTHATSITGGYQTLGRGKLSSTGVNNRVGYAGYQYDPTFNGAGRHLYHVRYRVFDSTLGRWMRRDPTGYPDGPSQYQYSLSESLRRTDPFGTSCISSIPDSISCQPPAVPDPPRPTRCIQWPLIPAPNCANSICREACWSCCDLAEVINATNCWLNYQYRICKCRRDTVLSLEACVAAERPIYDACMDIVHQVWWLCNGVCNELEPCDQVIALP